MATWLKVQVGDREREHSYARHSDMGLIIKEMMWVSGLEGISMQKNLLVQNKGKFRLGVILLLTLLACGGMLTLSYAQSIMGSAFNLNSPASFPVDI